MMKWLVLSLCVVLLVPALASEGSSEGAFENRRPMISKEYVDRMFADLKKEGWKVEGELVWGFYFFDKDAKKLVRLGAELEKQGFVW